MASKCTSSPDNQGASLSGGIPGISGEDRRDFITLGQQGFYQEAELLCAPGQLHSLLEHHSRGGGAA